MSGLRDDLPMSKRSDPSALRWLIGVELGNFRRHAGMSMSEVADRTHLTKPKLGHMEAGRHQQYPEDLETLLNLYGASQRDIDRVCSLASNSDKKTWWAPWSHVLPDWFRTFVGLEGLADAEFVYEPVVVPGLLQTEEYAKELTRATGFVRPDHSDRFVSFRRARAARLTEDDEPLKLHAVFEESVLRRKVGSADTMRAQYKHLIELADRDNLTVQVIRPEDGAHTAVNGQFFILEFAQSRSIVYNELIEGAVYVQDPDGVATYSMVADNLQRVALDPADSVALIKSLIRAR